MLPKAVAILSTPWPQLLSPPTVPHPSLPHPAAPWLHPLLPHSIIIRETAAFFLAPVFATGCARDFCNSHQIPGQIHADTRRVLYKTTCIWQLYEGSTLGKAIKHGFWGAFMRMAFQCLRGYRAQNTVMHRSYLRKSQWLSLGYCTSSRAFRAPKHRSTSVPALRPPILSLPFVLWGTKYILTSLKTVTTSFYRTCANSE